MPHVLVVDDHHPLATAVAKLLRDAGFSADIAGDGIAALQKIVATPPDLLLLDLQLPGLHGIELLRKLRASQRTRELAVIVMSGVYKGERYVAAARELGVVDYLEKPFPPARLLEAARRLTGVPASAPAPAPAAPAPTAAAPPLTFDKALLQALTTRFTGSYQLSGATSHELILIDGAPVALRPGFLHDDFGAYLLQRGFLSGDEHAAYRAAGAERHEMPVRMGCLGFNELLQARLTYLSGELVEGFRRPPFAVTPQPAPFAAGVQIVTVNLPQLFLEGYRSALSIERRRRLVEQLGSRFVALAPPYYEHINFLPLNEAERYLLPRLDGQRSVAAALEDNLELLPLLVTLHTLGMIRLAAQPLATAPLPPWPLRALFNAVEEVEMELPEEHLESFSDLVDSEIELPSAAPAPPAAIATAPLAPPAAADDLGSRVRATHAELQGKNYYEVFGMTQANFSFDRLRERYFAVTRAYGPDVLMQLVGAEADLVEEILSTVTNAFNTLSDVVKKENYDELLNADRIGLGHKGDDVFQAQVQAQSGKVFVEMAEWDNAEKSLQEACNAAPDNGDYLAHLAWAIYKNPKYANSRAMLDKAKQMLNRAVGMERTAEGFSFKGWVLLDGGQESLAEAEFNKALKLDARNLLARKGLRQIQEKREQQKKGLFNRMFGG